MVFVAVGEHDGAHLLAVLDQIGNVGNNDVHAEKFGFGKHQAGVDDDDVVAPAHGHAVHAELAQPAERHNMQFSSWHAVIDRSTSLRAVCRAGGGFAGGVCSCRRSLSSADSRAGRRRCSAALVGRSPTRLPSGSGSVSALTPCHPEEAESFAKRRAPDEGPVYCASSAENPARSRDTLSRWICATQACKGRGECTGPSLAFVRSRTKDCTQDDSLVVSRIVEETESN